MQPLPLAVSLIYGIVLHQYTGKGTMSLNRLLGVVRQRLWQVPKRPRSTNTAAEKFEGPESPNGFLFNEKVW